MNIIALKPTSPMPADFPKLLRELADRVERGSVTSFIAAMVENDSYEFVYPSSLSDSLVLSALLQAQCVDRMRGL